MKNDKELSVQCFSKKEFAPDFTKDARLLYVSETRPAASVHPRVMHAHTDYIEIVLICDGISEYLIDNKKQLIRKGDIIIYNSGIVHDEVSGPDIVLSTYCVAIKGINVNNLRKNALIPDGINPIFQSGEEFEEMKSICEIMFKNLKSDKSGAEQFCHYLMQAFVVKTLSVISTQEKQSKASNNELGIKIKQYIDEHYREPLTLEIIASSLHVSQYHISHVFKQMSGYSPMYYLLRRRIGEAQTLLIDTRLSIGEIAQRVGYDSQSAFNVQFTKNVGISPKKFRNSYLVK